MSHTKDGQPPRGRGKHARSDPEREAEEALSNATFQEAHAKLEGLTPEGDATFGFGIATKDARDAPPVPEVIEVLPDSQAVVVVTSQDAVAAYVPEVEPVKGPSPRMPTGKIKVPVRVASAEEARARRLVTQPSIVRGGREAAARSGDATAGRDVAKESHVAVENHVPERRVAVEVASDAAEDLEGRAAATGEVETPQEEGRHRLREKVRAATNETATVRGTPRAVSVPARAASVVGGAAMVVPAARVARSNGTGRSRRAAFVIAAALGMGGVVGLIVRAAGSNGRQAGTMSPVPEGVTRGDSSESATMPSATNASGCPTTSCAGAGSAGVTTSAAAIPSPGVSAGSASSTAVGSSSSAGKPLTAPMTTARGATDDPYGDGGTPVKTAVTSSATVMPAPSAVPSESSKPGLSPPPGSTATTPSSPAKLPPNLAGGTKLDG